MCVCVDRGVYRRVVVFGGHHLTIFTTVCVVCGVSSVFLGYFWGPMPIMIWVATLIVAIEGDMDDMSVLLTLQMINGGVGYYEERSAGDAIEALKKSLAPKANVKRDGRWREVGRFQSE